MSRMTSGRVMERMSPLLRMSLSLSLKRSPRASSSESP